MAHTKSGGAAQNWGDSIKKRLGVKLYEGQAVSVGQIIIRQRGLKFAPGKNVKRAGDDTLYAMKSGTVRFAFKRKTRFDRNVRTVSVVSVAEQR